MCRILKKLANLTLDLLFGKEEPFIYESSTTPDPSAVRDRYPDVY